MLLSSDHWEFIGRCARNVQVHFQGATHKQARLGCFDLSLAFLPFHPGSQRNASHPRPQPGGIHRLPERASDPERTIRDGGTAAGDEGWATPGALAAIATSWSVFLLYCHALCWYHGAQHHTSSSQGRGQGIAQAGYGVYSGQQLFFSAPF